MKHGNMKRLISLLLVLCMVVGLMSGLGVMADETEDLNYEQIDSDSVKLFQQEEAQGTDVQEEAPYADTDMVRAFVVMEGKSVLERGFSTQDIASNTAAMAVSQTLKAKQAAVAAQISAKVLDGEKLNIHWNLTLAANAMSVDLPYGKMAETAELPGVKDVFLVPQYELDPREEADLNTISSGTMVGSYNTWLEGYTGAGSRIAIIDTGIDSDHPSFNGDAFDYSLKVTATKNDKKVFDYNLLTASEISDLLPKLHAYERMEGLTGRDLFVNDKIAYGFNYVDSDLDITHDNDGSSDHGTHVSGIATANRYVKQADGTYAYADNGVVGIAPDAQLLTMKVFGKNGGAYADDYIAAIEDAIILSCDSVNLSLGSSAVGFTTTGEEYFDGVMDALSETDTVVTISAGNSGNWAEETPNGYLYTEDANTDRVGSPGAYENALTVASVDNTGNTSVYFSVGEGKYTYADGAGKNFAGGNTCKSNAFTTLDKSENKTGTEYDYVFIGDPTNPDDTVKYGGSKNDFAGTAGKIVIVSRGNGVPFTEKQNNAYAAKAAAIIVYNNVDGYDAIYAACEKTTPFITIRKDQMESILASSTKNENGVWGGKLTVYGSGVYTDTNATGGVVTMSDFSSWGVPGDLSLKPEIAAPGGNIYSTVTDGKYDVMSGTSMAAPSAAGQAAVVAQYIKENGLAEKTGMSVRALAQSLMMGTAAPVMDPEVDGVEYSPRRQGAGLTNVENAVNTPTYVTVNGYEDGKVKMEFGDDPDRDGTYSFSFQVHNMTGKAVTYKMSGSMLAPYVFEDSGTKYIATSDINIDGDFAFVSGNSGFDPNGDGKLDTGDVMAILNYAVDQAQLEDPESADFNGDGDTNEVDAQILNDILNGGSYNGITLEILKGVNTVTVPANGTATVTVTMSLSEDGRAYMEENFVNGNYVEGYVYLDAVADAEGKVAVSQSIPFLAYYGNWTDPSMFDNFVYAEDVYNADAHKYMSQNVVNYYNLKKTSGTTVLGVNAYARDTEFIADRTAVRTGDSLVSMTYSLTRNAEDVFYSISNAEDGTVYFSKEYGSQYGAFYYTNGGSWQYTATSKGLYWNFTDENGDPLPDGTKLNLTLTAIPEYYTPSADGSYTGLGKGATWNTKVTIDNEAPVVYQMFYASSADGSKTINVVAQDNQYIAAIQIIKADGSAMIGSLYPNQQTVNEKLALAFNAESLLSEDKVIIAVVDYAGNASAYMVELGKGGGEEPDPDPSVGLNGFFAFNTTNNTWSRFEPDTASTPEIAAEADQMYAAAEYVDGYTVACTTASDTTNKSYLTVMEHGKFKPTVVSMIDGVLIDMAYNKTDGNLYALASLVGEDGSPEYGVLVKVNYFTGELTKVGTIDSDMMPGSRSGDVPQVLACDDDGTFYIINSSTSSSKVNLYKFNLSEDGEIGEITKLGKVGQSLNYLQSMTIDHSTGKLYWARFYGSYRRYAELYELDKATGKATKISDLPGETTAMYVVRGQGGSTETTDKVERIQISQTSATMYSGYQLNLEAYVTPWNLTDRSVTWISSDPEVASVSDSGLVKALKAGTTTITVTSNLDKSFSAKCEITVLQNSTTLSGVVHDETGETYFATIDADSAAYTKDSAATEDEIFSAVMVGDQLMACGTNGLYNVDVENGYAMEKLTNMQEDVVFTDMAYSPHLDLTLATYGTFVLVVDPTAQYGHAGGWNLKSAFSTLAGITYAGHDNTYDYFYLLSGNGSLYLAGLQKGEDGKYTLGLLSILTTDKSLAITGQYMYQSLFYDLDTGWIYWARYDDSTESSSIIAINEDTEEVVLRGTFDDAAWPVVGLYNAKAAVTDADRTGAYNFSENSSLAPDLALGESIEAIPAESITSLAD